MIPRPSLLLPALALLSLGQANLVAQSGQSAPRSSPPSAAIMSDGVRPFSSLGVAVRIGAAGAGFDLATPLSPRLNLRGGASFFSYDEDFQVDGATVNGAIKLQNAAAMLDFFPFHNALRLSAGMTVYNDTGFNASLTAPPGQAFTLGDVDYTSDPSDPVHGSARFNFGGKIAPRFSLGTGNMVPRKGHWSFQTELGFQYFSEPTVTYSLSGQGCTGPNYTKCAPIPSSSIAQQQNDLQNTLSPLRFYPIFSLGFSYKIGASQPR